MDINEIMKQAQQMQQKMQQMQEQVANIEVTGEAGAGLVKVIMNGHHDVKKVTIDSAVLEEEKTLLEDLLAAAVNDAVKKLEQENRSKMSELTGGMNLPPDFKMPF